MDGYWILDPSDETFTITSDIEVTKLMGKRKEIEDMIITVDGDDTAPKKHKKHKHKKHKKKRTDSTVLAEPVKIKSVNTITSKSSIESPIKMGEVKTVDTPKSSQKKKKSKGGKESGTSSDEERWLDAIQSGKLEEVDDELKKIKPKDPKLMTARQRAMLERKGDAVADPAAEQLLSLPSGYREKVMTPEMIMKAALKQQKRKQLLDEKREKDKKRTMERLLRKQDNKQTKPAKRAIKRSGLTICYRNNQEGITITLPPGMDFPLKEQTSINPPAIMKCAVAGCQNPKKYSCSKTNVPLCSLECYKTNLASVQPPAA